MTTDERIIEAGARAMWPASPPGGRGSVEATRLARAAFEAMAPLIREEHSIELSARNREVQWLREQLKQVESIVDRNPIDGVSVQIRAALSSPAAPSVCPTCWGHGEAWLGTSATVTSACPTCEGTGKRYDVPQIGRYGPGVCLTCEGTGRATTETQEDT